MLFEIEAKSASAFKKVKFTKKAKPIVSAPAKLTNSATAFAVPPVANKSS